MHTLTRTPAARLVALLLALLFVATACTEGEQTSADQAREARNRGVDGIRERQPVSAMDYSPTLETINGWAETWGQEGKVAYVYMQRGDGSYAGYYVMRGLPVSYCASGSPTYDLVDTPDDGVNDKNQQVPAPGLDGAYYGGSGNCNRYYGFDAVSGAYIEYTDGMVLTAVLSDQPLPLDRQPEPYGSTIDDVERAGADSAED